MLKTRPIYFLLFFVVANLLLLDYWLVKSAKVGNKVLSATTSSCPSACVDLIRSKSGGEQVIAISASGSTAFTSWTTVAGSEISFNKATYAGARKIYFQVNLSTDAADKIAYARLYDATHGIGVTGSEASTNSLTLTQVQSQPMNPFGGDLTLKVQIKSLDGNLVTVTNPRIRIVY